MAKKKTSILSKILVEILSIIAVILIITIIAAFIMLVKNQDGEHNEIIEALDINNPIVSVTDDASFGTNENQTTETPTEIPSTFEDDLAFKVPVVYKNSDFDPFENTKNMDIYARNTPESHLGTVHFAYGKYEVNTQEFIEVMDQLTDKQKKECYFIIEGHTDSTSDWQFNKELSENRAESVKTMLIHLYGINENQIKTIGYSWDRLIVKPELTKEDKAANRRTEISCFCYEE